MKASRHLMSALLGSILVLLSAQNTYSQGFYFNAGGGYGFSASNISYVNLCLGFDQSYPYYDELNTTPFSFIGANQSYTATDGSAGSNYTSTYQGLGEGVNFFISAGYSFTKNISAELGFSYLPGTTLQSTYTDQETDNYNNPNESEIMNEAITSKLASSPIFRVLPTVKLSIPISKFTPYLKAGLIVGLGEKVTLSNAYSEVETETYFGTQTSVSSENDNMSLTASGGLSLGYTGSIGVEYKISDLISVCGEFNIVNENWSPTKGDITIFTVSDASPPYVLSTSQFTYSDNITMSGPSNNVSPSPGNNVIEVNSQYPKQTFSFNSYGFAIGVKFSIPTNKNAASPDSSPKAK